LYFVALGLIVLGIIAYNWKDFRGKGEASDPLIGEEAKDVKEG
jgi:hypothetical protein